MIAKYLFAGALSLIASSALAGYCSQNAATSGVSVDDFNYSPTGVAPFVSADDCYGLVSGNIAESGGPGGSHAYTNILSPLDWGAWATANSIYLELQQGATSDDATLAGITFSLTSTDSSGTSGNYKISATSSGTFDFVVALKASNGFGLWFFDNEIISANGGGTWTIDFDPNRAGNSPALSHLALMVRNSGPEDGCQSDCGSISIPEPGSLSLLGLGIAGLAAIRRRQR